MTERKRYVYRLKVTLPAGSGDPDWEPDGWDDDPFNHGQGFKWPQATLYLSPGNAEHRAGLIRKYGAQVTIERSEPVTWPSDTD